MNESVVKKDMTVFIEIQLGEEIQAQLDAIAQKMMVPAGGLAKLFILQGMLGAVLACQASQASQPVDLVLLMEKVKQAIRIMTAEPEEAEISESSPETAPEIIEIDLKNLNPKTLKYLRQTAVRLEKEIGEVICHALNDFYAQGE